MGLKSKLGMAIVASATGTVMVAGGAFALFTAQTSNTGNTFTAGTVKIADYSGGPVAKQAVYFNNLAPGDDGTLVMTVKNTGSLKAWVKIDQALTKASESGYLFDGNHPLVLNLWQQQPVTVDPGQTVNLRIPWSFPLGAGNDYQNKVGKFNVVIDAVQYRNNTGTPNFPGAGSETGSHVATSIQIAGPTEITAPMDGAAAVSEHYTATVYDQNHVAMSGQTLVWSLATPSDKISISQDGVLTVQSMTGQDFPKDHGLQPIKVTITTASGEVVGTYEVQIVKADEEPK